MQSWGHRASELELAMTGKARFMFLEEGGNKKLFRISLEIYRGYSFSRWLRTFREGWELLSLSEFEDYSYILPKIIMTLQVSSLLSRSFYIISNVFYS